MARAYYNEMNQYTASWLRNLINAGAIAPGDVDERSIEEVKPDDVRGYTQCHFFAGIGGWSRAMRLAGWPDDRPAWTGSCPCQPFARGGQQRGFSDARHLWPVWRQLIEECRPSAVLGEQSARASDWLRLVRGDLEAMGYAVGAMPIEAASAGAYHLRDRFWFVADANDGDGHWRYRPLQVGRGADAKEVPHDDLSQGVQWPAQPPVPILAYGVSNRMERCSAFGNAIDTRVAAAFVSASAYAMACN